VFTTRYALNPYIKQIRFVFKGLNACLFDGKTNSVVGGAYWLKDDIQLSSFFPTIEKCNVRVTTAESVERSYVVCFNSVCLNIACLLSMRKITKNLNYDSLSACRIFFMKGV
jgi:hypothetical protein